MSTPEKDTEPRELTSYEAAGMVEGFVPCPDGETYIRAIAHLIKTGMAWNLQGFFGRTCQRFIDGGIVDRDGVIDWDKAWDWINEFTSYGSDDAADDPEYFNEMIIQELESR